MIGNDVNFPTSPQAYPFGDRLSEAEIVSVRSRYLERAYRALSRYSRGSVLLQDARVITKEMVNLLLLGKKP